MVAIHGASPSGRFTLVFGRVAELETGLELGEVLRAAEVVRDLADPVVTPLFVPLRLLTDDTGGLVVVFGLGGLEDLDPRRAWEAC